MSLQGTDEWRKARLGKVTASRVADVMRRTKSGWSTSRANYMAELIAERLTGVPAETYTNGAMQWGIDKEPQARDDYELYTGSAVECVGFVVHAEIVDAGCSPDGFVGDDGLVEFKCPGTAKHIETLLGASIDGDYIKQMQWQMACTGRQWCDWCSFDPRLPVEMQMVIRRVPRDNALIAELVTAITTFLFELDGKIVALRSLQAEAA